MTAIGEDRRAALRRAARDGLQRAGVLEHALRLRRAFEPIWQTRDREDSACIRAVLAAALGPEACCVDVGANVGAVLDDIVRMAPRGRHIAFEPLPQLAEALRARHPEVEVHQCALFDEPGELPFVHVLSNPGWSGLRARAYPRPERTETITVPVRTLDDVLDPGYVPTLIKVDVEGAELQLLRGAARTLTTHRPILLLEHGLGSAEEYGTTPEALFDLVSGYGYRVFDVDGSGPLSRSEMGDGFRRQLRVNYLLRP